MWVGLVALAVLAGVAGCGGESPGTITGKVTADTGVVKGGRVIYSSAKGKSVMTSIKEDGSYTIEGVPPGEAKIAVQTKFLGVIASLAGIKSIPANSPQLAGQMSPDEAARRFVAILPQYEDPETSGLTYTVQSGSQEHNIPVQTGPGAGTKKGSSGGPPK
jgi:hypothetical protein